MDGSQSELFGHHEEQFHKKEFLALDEKDIGKVCIAVNSPMNSSIMGM